MPADELNDAGPPAAPLPGIERAALVARLRGADLEVLGRMPNSSNGTFLVVVGERTNTEDDAADGDERAVYKPLRGEQPLWDFPPGLHKREAAAYELSMALGWDVIPPTIVRENAPFGEGSLQYFVDGDFSEHHFTLVEDEAHHDRLRKLALFDVIANNTDRKSGHCLLGPDDLVWGIDNGLCFSEDFKLRTVIWEFGGEPVEDELLGDIERVCAAPPAPLCGLLAPVEVEAMCARGRSILRNGEYPVDHTGRRYPWPLV